MHGMNYHGGNGIWQTYMLRNNTENSEDILKYLLVSTSMWQRVIFSKISAGTIGWPSAKKVGSLPSSHDTELTQSGSAT